MGVLDWTNEYLNPFAESNRERQVREDKERLARERKPGKRMSREEFLREQEAAGSPVDQGTGRSYRETFADQDRGESGTRSANTPMGRAGGASELGAWDPGEIFTVGGGGAEGAGDQKRIRELMQLFGLSEGDVWARFKADDGVHVRAGDYLQTMFAWKSHEIEGWQRRLYKAGLLGRNPEAITWGVMDEVTVQGSATLMGRAARYMAAGQDRTISEVLAEAERERGQTAVKTSGYGQSEAHLREAMGSLLGRKPNAREVRRFKRRLNNAERSTVNAGIPGLDISPDDIEEDDDDFREGDAGLLAETEVLAENGVEHVQYAASAFTDTFERMMTGGR